MKVHWPYPRTRLAFVGAPAFSVEACAPTAWCDTQFFTVENEDWHTALLAVTRYAPEYCICYDPPALDTATLATVPGTKIAAIRRPHLTADEVERLAERDGFQYCLGNTSGPRIREHLPPLIDPTQCHAQPDLANWSIVACEGSQHGDATIIPRSASVETHKQTIRAHGIFLHTSTGPLDAGPWPLFALANGLLLVSTAAAPASWLLEEGEDFLFAPTPRAAEEILAGLSQSRAFTSAIRVRAWQKAREAFHANDMWQRIIADHLLRI